MSRSTGIAKVAGATVGVAGAAAGVGYAGQRLLARRLRRRPDGNAARALEAPVYIDRRIDAFDGGSIYLVESGVGPPIVLSHGVTNSTREWFHQLESLPREGFHAIAFDHRGHGQSAVGSAGHSVDNLAQDTRSVVEGLDLHDAVLVGHSMGGVAVQAFVTQFPEIAAERVAGIVLLSTLAKAPLGSVSTRTKQRIEQITNRAPDTGWMWSSPNLGLLLARLGFGRDPHPSHVELTRQMLRDCPPETRLDAPRALIGLDLTPELPKIEIPTLVIVGTGDILTPPAYARLIARLIPGARLEVFPGGGHMLMLERADELDRLIVEFAREVGVSFESSAATRAQQAVLIPIAGLALGHWTGDGTGVTVLLVPEGTIGAGEVRGGAPATREVALLEPSRSVAHVDAVVLAGGSAFGLAAADGVMRYLAERGRGFPTAGGPVPIVPAACVFDLVESHGAAPGAEEGYAAANAATTEGAVATGRVGAGRGATVGKWRGRDHAVAGGFGVAGQRCDDAQVVAFAVVNAVGDVVAEDGTIVAGSTARADAPPFPTDAPFEEKGFEEEGANTTLVVVVTDAVCDKSACFLIAQSAHDGLARALRPAHTRFDGDLAIALATGSVETQLDRLRAVTADVVAEAIRMAPR